MTIRMAHRALTAVVVTTLLASTALTYVGGESGGGGDEGPFVSCGVKNVEGDGRNLVVSVYTRVGDVHINSLITSLGYGPDDPQSEMRNVKMQAQFDAAKGYVLIFAADGIELRIYTAESELGEEGLRSYEGSIEITNPTHVGKTIALQPASCWAQN